MQQAWQKTAFCIFMSQILKNCQCTPTSEVSLAPEEGGQTPALMGTTAWMASGGAGALAGRVVCAGRAGGGDDGAVAAPRADPAEAGVAPELPQRAVGVHRPAGAVVPLEALPARGRGSPAQPRPTQGDRLMFWQVTTAKMQFWSGETFRSLERNDEPKKKTHKKAREGAGSAYTTEAIATSGTKTRSHFMASSHISQT